jgi:hypothetical protein
LITEDTSSIISIINMAMAKREKGTTFLLRDVPSDIWRRARSRAVLEGRTIRAVIIELLDQWAHDGGFVELSKRRKQKKS